MAAGKNVKFQGSAIAVAISKATAKVISGVSKANPAVVTSTAHGYAAGTLVWIAAVVGMVELNGSWYEVANPAANTFELKGIDSTGYTTYVSGGTAQDPVWANWCEVKGWNETGGQSDELEVTTICSLTKEYETGLADTGTISADFNFAPKTGVHAFLRAAQISGDTVPFRLTLPSAAGVITYLCGITQLSLSGAVSGVWEGSMSLRAKQAPIYA